MGELQTVLRQFGDDEKHRFSGHAMLRRTAVSLEQLPEALKIPDYLRHRISYESARKLLVFRGFMSSADYYFLRSCSGDANYIRAINELHEKSSFELHCRPRIVPLWLWALVTASFALAALVWLGWILES